MVIKIINGFFLVLNAIVILTLLAMCHAAVNVTPFLNPVAIILAVFLLCIIVFKEFKIQSLKQRLWLNLSVYLGLVLVGYNLFRQLAFA
ncbi:MAG: hypothetical protein PVG41_03450 [Desulfobacteraceae bacterium]|jgi:hypothetical protein